MFNYQKLQYGEKLKFFLEEFKEDKLLKYIIDSGWLEELCADEKFFGFIELDTTYTNNQAANLLSLSSSQRILNLINNRDEMVQKYIMPAKIGDRYAHDPIILFKLKMVFFLYSKNLTTAEIESILGLAAASTFIPNPKRNSRLNESIQRTQIRQAVIEQMAPFFEAIQMLAEYQEKSIISLKDSFEEELEYTEEMNKLLIKLSEAEREIAYLEKRIAELAMNANTLTTNLENFEQVKRLNLKNELITNVSKQQPVAKQGFFKRLFGGKQELDGSEQFKELEEKLQEIDRKSINNLFTDKEMEKYKKLLEAIKTNTDELNQAMLDLGSTKERKKNLEEDIEKLRNKLTSLKNIEDQIKLENPFSKIKQLMSSGDPNMPNTSIVQFDEDGATNEPLDSNNEVIIHSDKFIEDEDDRSNGIGEQKVQIINHSNESEPE